MTKKLLLLLLFLCAFFSELSANEININEYTPGKGEKLTIVKYENAHYVITGWVKKNAFVNGSPIEIKSHDSGLSAWVAKRMGRDTLPDEVVMSGVFRATEKAPMVEGEAKCSLFRQFEGLKNGKITGVFEIRNMPDGSFSAKKKLKSSNRYGKPAFNFYLNQIKEVRAKIEGSYSIVWGQKIVFVQKVSPYGSGIEQWLEGVCFENKPISSMHRMMVVKTPDISLPEDKWRIEYSDGDVYEGSLLGEGEMRLSTGETIKTSRSVSDLITGKTDYRKCYWIVFPDGEEMKSLDEYWWSTLSKGLTVTEQRELLLKAKSPTELRDKTRVLINSKQEEEKRKQEQSKREKQLREEQAAAKYISLYGEKYGRAVYEKRVTDGMTRKMVTEFLPSQYYLVTKKGAKEVWVFSEKNVESILKSSPDGVKALLVVRMFGGSLGNLLRTGSVMGVVDIPLSITFSNGRVISITR